MSCSNGNLNPEKININAFDGAIKELTNKSLDLNLVTPNPAINMSDIVLKNFYFNKNLIRYLPECYKLLKSNKAIEIVYFSHECIFIILRKHKGIFKDRLECIKVGDLNKCDLSNRSQTAVEKEVRLKKGLSYQIVIQYIET